MHPPPARLPGLAALLVLALAGCVAPAATTAPLATHASAPVAAELEDAEGDAFEPTLPARLAGLAGCADCLPAQAGQGRAAPYYDITRASLAEGADDTLLLTLTLAGVAEGFPELEDDPLGAHQVAFYEACLGDEEDEWGCALLMLAKAGGAISALGTYTFYDEACNAWSRCIWDVPVVLTPGTPATIVFTLPKAAVAWGVPARTIAYVEGGTAVAGINPLLSAWHAAYSVHSPVVDAHDHPGGAGTTSYLADWFEDDVAPLVVAPVGAPSPAPATAGRVISSPAGNFYAEGSPADRPELDILAVDLAEEASDLVATFTLASYDAPTWDHIFVMGFGTLGDPVWEIGYLHEPQHGGYGFAGHCITFTCDGGSGGVGDDHDMSHATASVVAYEIEPGTPGKVRIRAPMSTFPTIQAGDTTTLVTTIDAVVDGGVWFGMLDDPIHGDAHKMSAADVRIGGAPYTFLTGNEASGHEHA